MGDTGEDVPETTCAECGAPIDTQRWHPVVAEDDDSFEVLAFCDEECREAWEE